ncbi:fimbrillin family protein, partial [Bacteroides sp. OttesenSCG-928-E20]|nr:fimbrillin family protein [Bacteroides sp. OttesenSCG-928-E20]MDL2306358.1 fimbrillin family protein [Bacteroides sp. OttesenSCG-928-D19]
MRTIHLSMLLCSLVWLTSCNSDTDTGYPLQTGIPVKFGIELSADFGAASRAITIGELTDDIGIYVVKGTAELKPSGNYAENVRLTCTDGAWSTDTPIFYPVDGEKLHFYAYYPYKTQMTDPTNHFFNVNTNQNTVANFNNSQLMMGKTADVMMGNDPVLLTLAPALAMVEVKVLKGETEYISGLDGELGLALTSVLRRTTLSWDTPCTGTGDALTVHMYKVPDAAYTYRALVPAQTLSADATVTIVNYINGGLTNTKYTGIQSATLTAGNVHKYEVTLSGPPATVAQSYNVGDVYPHPDAAEGIVFYTTPNGYHGLVLSLDEGEKLQFYTSSVTTKIVDSDNGLANTCAFYALNPGFTNYSAFAWVHTKNGGGTTNYYNGFVGTWYLPAANELKKLAAAYSGLVYENIAGTWTSSSMPGWDSEACIAARAAFNDKLTAAGGTPLEDKNYWSSSETPSSSSQYCLILSPMHIADKSKSSSTPCSV